MHSCLAGPSPLRGWRPVSGPAPLLPAQMETFTWSTRLLLSSRDIAVPLLLAFRSPTSRAVASSQNLPAALLLMPMEIRCSPYLRREVGSAPLEAGASPVGGGTSARGFATTAGHAPGTASHPKG